MKKNLKISLLLIVCFFSMSFTCNAQNGPTQPSVTLGWTQSITTGVTANCVYRGATAGNYNLPAIFCSTAPIVSYKDTTVVRGQTYHYAVTAKVGATEGDYSTDVIAVVPLAPASPIPSGTVLITKLRMHSLSHR